MKRLLLATAVLLQSSAFAQTVYGKIDCGQWLSDQGASRTQNQAWVLGYLSGMNVGVNGANDKDTLRKLNSMEQVFVWMDNYCRSNSLEKVRTGANQLFAELERRR